MDEFKGVIQQATKNFIEKYMDIPKNITYTGYKLIQDIKYTGAK